MEISKVSPNHTPILEGAEEHVSKQQSGKEAHLSEREAKVKELNGDQTSTSAAQGTNVGGTQDSGSSVDTKDSNDQLLEKKYLSKALKSLYKNSDSNVIAILFPSYLDDDSDNSSKPEPEVAETENGASTKTNSKNTGASSESNESISEFSGWQPWWGVGPVIVSSDSSTSNLSKANDDKQADAVVAPSDNSESKSSPVNGNSNKGTESKETNKQSSTSETEVEASAAAQTSAKTTKESTESKTA